MFADVGVTFLFIPFESHHRFGLSIESCFLGFAQKVKNIRHPVNRKKAPFTILVNGALAQVLLET